MFKSGFRGLWGFMMNIRNELLFLILDLIAGLLAFAVDPFKFRNSWLNQSEIVFFIVYVSLAVILMFLLVFIFHCFNFFRNGKNYDDISLFPISRENGKYASLRVTNNNQEKPVLCKATIRKMDWFKQDLNNAEGGEWKPINTEECGPLSWHYGGSDDEGFKKIHGNPEFINIARITDNMNKLVPGYMFFTFLVEKSYLVGKYRVWIDVIYKSDEAYKTVSWPGCIDQDFTPKLYKLLIKECEDVKD